jgi:undecaprenyl-diphosphatase
VNVWQGIVLGLVQGLTEFLPVSSSGHLALTEALLGVKTPGVFVEVSLHVATLGSVLIVYGARAWEIVRGMLSRSNDAWRHAGLLIVATIPAAIVGKVFHERIEASFKSLLFVGIAFVVTGFVLWSTRRLTGDRPLPSWRAALGIGLAQSIAVLPGISRSGSTVSAALWAKLAPVAAAEFSFLMAMPVIAGAALLEGRHAAIDVAAVGVVPYAVSLLVALVSGVFAIRFLVALLKRGRFSAFAPYCWLVGAFTIAYSLWRA